MKVIVSVGVAAALVATALLVYANGTFPVVEVDTFDRQEIQRHHDSAQKSLELRDRMIDMTARRHGISLREYLYDIEKGVFIPREETNEETP